MMYLLQRGPGSLRRVAHLQLHDQFTGKPTGEPLCGIRRPFNLNSNVPWGCRTCKNCLKAASRMAVAS
jgi:hypothetical protein